MDFYCFCMVEGFNSNVLRAFDGLPKDQYMPSDSCYRFRRYLTGNVSGGVVFWDSDASVFTQTKELNRYVGGVSRQFQPIQRYSKDFVVRSLMPNEEKINSADTYTDVYNLISGVVPDHIRKFLPGFSAARLPNYEEVTAQKSSAADLKMKLGHSVETPFVDVTGFGDFRVVDLLCMVKLDAGDDYLKSKVLEFVRGCSGIRTLVESMVKQATQAPQSTEAGAGCLN